jgi:hypothetical protein
MPCQILKHQVKKMNFVSWIICFLNKTYIDIYIYRLSFIIIFMYLFPFNWYTIYIQYIDNLCEKI